MDDDSYRSIDGTDEEGPKNHHTEEAYNNDMDDTFNSLPRFDHYIDI